MKVLMAVILSFWMQAAAQDCPMHDEHLKGSQH
jgi:hypothetical protein